MKPHGTLQDPDYLKHDQYRDSGNLTLRASLHQRFSTNPVGWHEWVFDQIALTPGEVILECGSGPGWLWRSNVDRIPTDCIVTLTDLSPGMVTEAETALRPVCPNMRFRVANIESLPFEDQSFDNVVANHMLYHVPDLERAFAEVRRVLRPGGSFYAATNGRDHMQELWQFGVAVAGDLLPESASPNVQAMVAMAFGLENGADQLEPWFSDITLFRYPDSLEVTEVEPLMAYILSSPRVRASLMTEALEAVLDMAMERAREIISEQGAFRITKSTGLFVARRPLLPS